MDNVGRLIIAYCIQHPQCLIQCVDKLKPEYFEFEESVIFRAIQQHYGKYNKCITYNLLDRVLHDTNIDAEKQVDLLEIFEEADSEPADPDEFEYYLDQLKEEYTKRCFLAVLQGGVDEEGSVTESLSDIVSRNPQEAYEVFNKTIGLQMEKAINEDEVQSTFIHEAIAQYLEEYEELQKNPEKAYGIKTGYSQIDERTLGIKPGQLFVIGGDTGAGKSILLLNIAINAYRAGRNILIVSIEMPVSQYRNRFLACYCDIPIYVLDTGRLETKQLNAIKQTNQEVADRWANNHYLQIVDIPSVTARTIEAQIHELIIKCGFKPDLVVVDYIGIMQSIDKTDSDWKEQSAIAQQLRLLARRKSLGVLSAVQLNRDKKAKGVKKIARSYELAAHCDALFILEGADEKDGKREDEDEDRDRTDILKLDDTLYVLVGKVRQGKAGRFQLFKNYGSMIVKNKDFYNPKTQQELKEEQFKSLQDISEDEELQISSSQEAPEDKKAREDGEFIPSD